jgi:DNA-binding Xre family transcriptional regulator
LKGGENMKADLYIDPAKLKIATARACLSFRRLAQRADLSPETVTRLYRSKSARCVTTETAGKLARALNVDVLDILRSEENEGNT